MAKIIPDNRPNISLDYAREILDRLGAKDATIRLVGIRGYWKRTMGDPLKNDRRMYDDALAVVLRDRVVTFNFNTDPNGWRKGHGKGGVKGMATLVEGLYESWCMGKHKGQYWALVQTGGEVLVRRDADASVPEKDIVEVDGEKFYEESGYFGINIHRGGVSGTSSLGCQTVPPGQYDEFQKLVYAEMKKAGMKKIQYGLVLYK